MERYNRLQNDQNDNANQIRLLKEQLSDCNNQLSVQKDQRERNNQIDKDRQLNDCTNEKAALQGNIDALNTRIRELMQKIKDCEGRTSANEATLVELFTQIGAKNGMPVRVRHSVDNKLPDDGMLRNEDFYKAVDWAAFFKNFNSWYVRMSR